MDLHEAKTLVCNELTQIGAPIEELTLLKHLDNLDGPRVSLFITLHALQVLQDEDTIKVIKEGNKKYYTMK